jgi:hypothetical protein
MVNYLSFYISDLYIKNAKKEFFLWKTSRLEPFAVENDKD